jgi:hypothetical protein
VTGPVATGPTWFHKKASFSSEKSSLASVVLAAEALYVVEEYVVETPVGSGNEIVSNADPD